MQLDSVKNQEHGVKLPEVKLCEPLPPVYAAP